MTQRVKNVIPIFETQIDIRIVEEDGSYFIVMEIEYTNASVDVFGVHFTITPDVDTTDEPELLEYVDASNPGMIVELLVDTSPTSLMQEFITKNNDSKFIIEGLKKYLNKYRNLGEDYYAIL